ncbi:E3 ubiquitin-protein ligase UPL6 [Acorus gramineus]|uniref:HECT-type E3 ubiquitin transferase n=1 Tax=Acorus gramineus TaxID=55184 RepID=A0AAV9BMK2_ACOGR|nr:E3 ubiquitin-protein ligase UPL6 [Acorus gramineus]
MFFSGDSSARKRVDLGGRSTKERDRKKLLEETHLERKRRMEFRQRNAAALTFQRILRGRSVVRAERRRMREEFRARYGDRCQNVDRHCFGPDSKFLPQLLFIFDEKNAGDFNLLVGACWKLRQFVRESGNIVSLLSGSEYMIKRMQQDMSGSSLEHVVILLASHADRESCNCPNLDPRWSFYSQVLTVPFLLRRFPFLKQVFDDSGEFPGYACLLGNLLETAEAVLSQPSFTFDVVRRFSVFCIRCSNQCVFFSSTVGSTLGDDEMYVDEESVVLNSDLETQISEAIDSKLPQQLVNALFRDVSLVAYPPSGGSFGADAAAVAAICGFLHVTFNILPLARFMTGLAYKTELVPVLWNFIKKCHENQQWPSWSKLIKSLSGDVPGWLLPLSVFCPVYKHMLMIVDNEDFYEQEKPLSLMDIRCLVIILKQALWQLLWVNPSKFPALEKSTINLLSSKKLSSEFIQYKVKNVVSELLSQLEDWNSRKPFTSASDFHVQEAIGENFISQASTENNKVSDVLKQAPFLVPFTSRVRIFTSWLAACKQRDRGLIGYTHHRFRIRRDRIFEDAFSQLGALSEEDLRETIRISFINEFGEEEAGIDGGGIFKDFMENITREAFNVQYGLFKETPNHLLYPNPGSGLIHEQHLDFFKFLGIIIGKAMFEGILVDIPFATFFLSKLKQKSNYLNDLPSLDPELYRHLLFLKNFKGDVSELELYFVVINNEYGEQTESELLPGGKDRRVTNDNVRLFIHLVAEYRLNYQIRNQSSYFSRGFQLLIQKEWIDLFNEHELQLLISGSSEHMDLDDLRSNANYSGGYHPDHQVIRMFWEVVKSFSTEHQKKFLKFVTGCSRGPLLGFKYLEPKFCIQRAAPLNPSAENLDRLPTSATCMNLLKLPPYNSKEQMATKLMYAISADAGFDLS